MTVQNTGSREAEIEELECNRYHAQLVSVPLEEMKIICTRIHGIKDSNLCYTLKTSWRYYYGSRVSRITVGFQTDDMPHDRDDSSHIVTWSSHIAQVHLQEDVLDFVNDENYRYAVIRELYSENNPMSDYSIISLTKYLTILSVGCALYSRKIMENKELFNTSF